MTPLTTFLSAPWKWRQMLLLLLLGLVSLLPSTFAQGLPKEKDDYKLTYLPGAPEPLLEQYAGHIEITPEHHGNLFFWFFKSRTDAGKKKTLIWFNGGPGCSSLDGLLLEMGPYRTDGNEKLTVLDGGWDQAANVLFIDNPVGTGFSYVDGDSLLHELTEMREQVVQFLMKFYSLFPEHEEDEIYIAGESYAGQHIPHVAKAIVERNAEASKKWDVQGLLIGNGWISGPSQYLTYIPMAYEAGMMRSGDPADIAARQQEKQCINDLQAGGSKMIDVGSCEAILSVILRETKVDQQTCYNMYDTRLQDSWPACGMNWPQGLQNVTHYLRQEDVVSALHVNDEKHTGWLECNSRVSRAFTVQNSQPSNELLPELLEHMRIILFAGDKDLICNYLGIEDLISKLSWNGATGMKDAPKTEWTFENEPAGMYREARNLTYLRFYNSSHMVPWDHPLRARDMFERFIGGAGAGHSTLEQIDANPSTPKPPSTPHTTPSEDESQDEDEGGEKTPTTEGQSTWQQYKKSGEVALAVVIIAVIAWGFFVWRGRRRGAHNTASGARYQGLFGGEAHEFDSGRRGGRQSRDIEAAAAWDEAELDVLDGGVARGKGKGRGKGRGGGEEEDAFVLESESESESQSDSESESQSERRRGNRDGSGRRGKGKGKLASDARTRYSDRPA